jgi:DNA-binding transcriptional ArsR family regulator
VLDLLRNGPLTTGALAEQIPELSRFAVMQHLGVLTDAGVVLIERHGRDRFNYLNPVPLREWYERWVQPLADADAAALLRLKRTVETGGETMSIATESVRTVRLAYELRIRASAQRTFEVMTQESLAWFPHTYGRDRVRAVVLEPRVGGRHYEDWGEEQGHLYGHVTLFDPPRAWAVRGRLAPGVLLDHVYELTEEPGPVTVVRITKVAVGPLSDEEAEGIATFGDIRSYAPAIEALAAS